MRLFPTLRALLCGVLAAAAPLPLRAQEASTRAIVRPLGDFTQTWTGEPIAMPRGHLRLIVSNYEIAPGAVLPVHKHPYPRYAYVQAGLLRVTEAGSGKSRDFKPGDVIVEGVDQWHFGTNIGSDPVALLVMDFLPKGKTVNTVLRKPPNG
ncbi:MAG: cupin domain-containing protein [Bradyrhizobiaceae bacterium]|nr:MAG: cupin domain-containing protein [Bradyrhizobiaceae bacterium]